MFTPFSEATEKVFNLGSRNTYLVSEFGAGPYKGWLV